MLEAEDFLQNQCFRGTLNIPPFLYPNLVSSRLAPHQGGVGLMICFEQNK